MLCCCLWQNSVCQKGVKGEIYQNLGSHDVQKYISEVRYLLEFRNFVLCSFKRRNWQITKNSINLRELESNYERLFFVVAGNQKPISICFWTNVLLEPMNSVVHMITATSLILISLQLCFHSIFSTLCPKKVFSRWKINKILS